LNLIGRHIAHPQYGDGGELWNGACSHYKTLQRRKLNHCDPDQVVDQ
jgi:hypothetical protein